MTRGPKFTELYEALGSSSKDVLEEGQAAASKTSFPGIFVSRDAQGIAALVIEEVVGGGGAQLASYNLRGVTAQFGVVVELLIDGEWRRTTCAVVRCLQSQDANIRFFWGLCESIANSAGDLRVRETLVSAIDRLVWIFSRLSNPGKREITGLIGELIFLSAHSDPVSAALAWRSSPTDRFDFVFDSYRVDVKATVTRSRSHLVTYEQANPPGESVAFFASVLIEELAVGMTGEALFENVLKLCSRDVVAQLKVQQVVMESLGMDLADFLAFTFDGDLANSSFQIYDARCVPALRDLLPGGVSRVKFLSDFSLAESTELP